MDQLPDFEIIEATGAGFLELCERVKREGRSVAVAHVLKPGLYRCEIRTLTPRREPE